MPTLAELLRQGSWDDGSAAEKRQLVDALRATPRNEVLGSISDAMNTGINWMKSPERTQQMQGLGAYFESTGIPKTAERMAYGEPLTNINRANVPLLKPETADALMNVAPVAGDVAKLAGKGLLGAGRLAGGAVNDAMVYGRGSLASITPQPMRMVNDDFVNKTQNIEGLLGQSKVASKIDEPMRTFKTSDGYTLYETKEGKIVDNLDPDSVDMSWDNYKQLKDDFGDDVYQVGDDLGKRKSATSSTGNPNLLDDWYSYRAEPTKDELFQQALNKQNEPKKASIVPIEAAMGFVAKERK